MIKKQNRVLFSLTTAVLSAALVSTMILGFPTAILISLGFVLGSSVTFLLANTI